MANYIEATDNTEYPGKNLFLAGGITACRDWQTEVWNYLSPLPNLNIYNPRRKEYPTDPDAAKEQITWEFNWLNRCDAILFWFASETIQPIALLEFGRWTALSKKLFVGCHLDYIRKDDIKIQLELIRPDQQLHYSLHNLIMETYGYYSRYQNQLKSTAELSKMKGKENG